ncbi:hypothetical protein ZWY2020_035709 [Hordeum vulgare]|nr:hypothetical protein ZWY2020_035709 [Hordeum vulgare]
MRTAEAHRAARPSPNRAECDRNCRPLLSGELVPPRARAPPSSEPLAVAKPPPDCVPEPLDLHHRQRLARPPCHPPYGLGTAPWSHLAKIRRIGRLHLYSSWI